MFRSQGKRKSAWAKLRATEQENSWQNRWRISVKNCDTDESFPVLFCFVCEQNASFTSEANILDCSTHCQRAGLVSVFRLRDDRPVGPGPIAPDLLSKLRSTSPGSHVRTRGRVTYTPPRHTYASGQWTTRDARVSRGSAPQSLEGAHWLPAGARPHAIEVSWSDIDLILIYFIRKELKLRT